VKKDVKNRSSADSHSASDAATQLGVSIPTLKRMVKDGTVEGFRTPGGHLRISAESIEAAKNSRQARPRARESSPVLQNRRERVEELTLEAQELRAKRELGKLRREEQEEAEAREAEAQARQEEAEQRRAEIVTERERLEHEKAEDRRRRQREQAEEEARLEAEQELAVFRERWYALAAQAVTTPRLNWLTASQRKEVTDALESEVDRRQPADAPRMTDILARSLAALVEPLQAERDVQERRQRLTEEALRSLPYSATEAEKLKATAVVREALRRFDSFADGCEMRVAAQEAVQPVRQGIERRELDAKLLRWAMWELPWSKNDQDAARVRRECTEILAELPIEISEAEGKEALAATVAEARSEIEQRQAEKERQAKKARLVAEGVADVVSYMAESERRGDLTREEYYDSELADHLRTIVRRGLESDLTGDESTKEVRELAREIIDGDIE
jgi:excisionase family DNA binding protein